MSTEKPRVVSRHILVVDDDPQTLEVVTRSLAADAHRVIACASFDEGKAALEQSTPDAVIADIRLKGRNGLQLLWLAKELHPWMRAIAITGFDDVDLRREATKMGATFLTKPFSPSELRAVVEHTFAVSNDPRVSGGNPTRTLG
jgi:DNA-binding NtrC family response regulator